MISTSMPPIVQRLPIKALHSLAKLLALASLSFNVYHWTSQAILALLMEVYEGSVLMSIKGCETFENLISSFINAVILQIKVSRGLHFPTQLQQSFEISHLTSLNATK